MPCPACGAALDISVERAASGISPPRSGSVKNPAGSTSSRTALAIMFAAAFLAWGLAQVW